MLKAILLAIGIGGSAFYSDRGLDYVAEIRKAGNPELILSGTSYSERLCCDLTFKHKVTRIFAGVGYRIGDRLYLEGIAGWPFVIETVDAGWPFRDTNIWARPGFLGFGLEIGVRFKYLRVYLRKEWVSLEEKQGWVGTGKESYRWWREDLNLGGMLIGVDVGG